MILSRRSCGVLLHITSLPGPHGIGDFGPAAYHFVDWLVSAGQSLWQILPMTPIGPGNSPYQSVSAFAGSPLMVALEPLVEQGWLAAASLQDAPFDGGRVDYARVVPWREKRLREAAAGFADRGSAVQRAAFADWCARNSGWLDDYALFMALEAAQAAAGWWEWPAALARREPAALAQARRELAGEIAFWNFVQWCFDEQWRAIKAYANERGVAIMGDLPIFVARHSADIWARPELFLLDAEFEPRVVAGVPPDFFSATGQRWGNPLYDWSRMAADGYRWWTERIRRTLEQADVFRIDHFRGFAASWHIAADQPTAVVGEWVPGPGKALFDAVAGALGPLPIIAEDLGVITPDVVALRDACGFPGMRVLQFAFSEDARHPFLPHNYVSNTVVYSGTHDNDTSRGWWDHATAQEQAFAGAYLDAGAHNIHWAMIRAACTSVARIAVFPMQDTLGLDRSHRMNLPGTLDGNWGWRLDWSQVGPEPARILSLLARVSGRTGVEDARLPRGELLQ